MALVMPRIYLAMGSTALGVSQKAWEFINRLIVRSLIPIKISKN
jgi:hypothetical protein